MFDLNPFKLSEREGEYILVGHLGSKAYGTDTAESDFDFCGIAVAPRSCYVGLDSWENDGTLKINKKEDLNAEMTVFELQKFLRLCLAFNPNAIPLLYLRDCDYELRTEPGNWLIRNRSAFNSRRAYKTMIGYAESQRKAVINGDTGKLGMKRKELVAKYGYDVKFASHTIRLLRMANEFFNDGNFITYRENDREELLDIRNGKWTLEQWLKEVDHALQLAKQAEAKALLPEKPDYDFVNGLCQAIINGWASYD